VADLLNYQTSKNMPTNDFWMLCAYEAKTNNGDSLGGDPWWSLIGMNDATSTDRQHIYINSTSGPTVQRKTGGISRNTTNGSGPFPYSVGDIIIVAGRFSSTQGITCFSKNVTTDAAIVTSASDTTAEAKADAVVPVGFGIGRDIDSSVAYGKYNIKHMRIFELDSPDSVIEQEIANLAATL